LTQTAFLEDEEEAIQDVRSGRSYGRRCSLTFLDNILTVEESAGDKERAGRPLSCSGGLLEELRWGYEKEHGGKLRRGALVVIRALPESVKVAGSRIKTS
jgi:hypothetical protein